MHTSVPGFRPALTSDTWMPAASRRVWVASMLSVFRARPQRLSRGPVFSEAITSTIHAVASKEDAPPQSGTCCSNVQCPTVHHRIVSRPRHLGRHHHMINARYCASPVTGRGSNAARVMADTKENTLRAASGSQNILRQLRCAPDKSSVPWPGRGSLAAILQPGLPEEGVTVFGTKDQSSQALPLSSQHLGRRRCHAHRLPAIRCRCFRVETGYWRCRSRGGCPANWDPAPAIIQSPRWPEPDQRRQ